MRQLTEELQSTQMRLRTMREEAERTNEDLRAANEELQSINEEYRSSSEELETSKEELQSVNEELQTVNNELKLKLEAVSRAHSDLQNLITAMDFGTLFLDSRLRIKRFTPRLRDIFNVNPSDEGRPITDLTHQLESNDWLNDVRTVIADLVPVAREIRSRSRRFDLRLRPYRTLDDKIDGVVISFVDVTERRSERDALRRSEEAKEVLIRELEHRTRNLLAVVQAVSAKTLRQASSMQEYRALFDERIQALSRVQALLSRGGESKLVLGELLNMELQSLGTKPVDNRVVTAGPEVALPARAVQLLALVIHELATNAFKHGALRNPQGRLSVSWQVRSVDGRQRLELNWAESGMTGHAEDAKAVGSGRELIENLLPQQLNAEVRFELLPDGLHFAIDMLLEADEK